MTDDECLAQVQAATASLGDVLFLPRSGGVLMIDDGVFGWILDGRIYLATDEVSDPLFAAAGYLERVFELPDGTRDTIARQRVIAETVCREPDTLLVWIEIALETERRGREHLRLMKMRPKAVRKLRDHGEIDRPAYARFERDQRGEGDGF